jgi:hypothetical protein
MRNPLIGFKVREQTIFTTDAATRGEMRHATWRGIHMLRRRGGGVGAKVLKVA